MTKVTHPVRLLFILYVCSLFLFIFLFSLKTEDAGTATSNQNLSFIEILNESIKGAGKGVTDWFTKLFFVAILHLIFLVGLKLVSKIKVEELVLFFVIIIPLIWVGEWLFSLFPFEFITNYSIALTVSIVSFLLLRISGHWD